MTATTQTASNLATQLELRRKLLLIWDEGTWQAELKDLAQKALNTGMTASQARQFQNVCTSARSCNDVYNFLFAQMGKKDSAWPTTGWPVTLLKLLQDLQSKAMTHLTVPPTLENRLAVQSGTLMLFRKCGESLAAFLCYFLRRRGGK